MAAASRGLSGRLRHLLETIYCESLCLASQPDVAQFRVVKTESQDDSQEKTESQAAKTESQGSSTKSLSAKVESRESTKPLVAKSHASTETQSTAEVSDTGEPCIKKQRLAGPETGEKMPLFYYNIHRCKLSSTNLPK